MSEKPKTSTPEVEERNADDLPSVITYKVLDEMIGDCKKIIEYLSLNKNRIKTLQITKAQFEKLTKERITSEAFADLIEADNVIEDEGYYSLKPWPHIAKFVQDPEIQQAANKFYTKCLFKYLHDTYKGDTMKKKWYDAIKKENKLDLKNFKCFTNVTRIGKNAFYENELIEVTIPNSVTSIGDSAFYHNPLIEVTIPNSVTSIEDEAFRSNQLTQLTIGNNVTTIGQGAFENKQLNKLTIPNSVTIIGDWAFRNNQFTEVTIGNNVATIGQFTFDPNVEIIREGDVIPDNSKKLLKLKF